MPFIFNIALLLVLTFGSDIWENYLSMYIHQVSKAFPCLQKLPYSLLQYSKLMKKRRVTRSNFFLLVIACILQAKRKESWLIEKLRNFEVPKALEEPHDPEILTEEEKFYLKRTGEKKKNYVPVGRRGVFGGVVLNMHLHWKKHETVKVVCRPCKPGQIHEYAAELTRLSRGIVIDIKPDNTIIFYRGKNYVQPDVMSPPDTLSKDKVMYAFFFWDIMLESSCMCE